MAISTRTMVASLCGLYQPTKRMVLRLRLDPMRERATGRTRMRARLRTAYRTAYQPIPSSTEKVKSMHQEEDGVVEDFALSLGKFDHVLPVTPADCNSGEPADERGDERATAERDGKKLTERAALLLSGGSVPGR